MVFAVLRLALGVAILGYLYKSGAIDVRPLAKLVPAWHITLAALAVLLADVFLMALRTCWMLEPVGLHLTIWNSFQLNLVTSFFSNVAPGAAGADAARLFYATRGNTGTRAEVATVMILDRAVGFFSMLLLPLVFAPFFWKLLGSVRVLRSLLLVDAAAGGGIFLAFLLCLYSPAMRSLIALEFLRWERWRRLAERVLHTLGLYRQHFRTLLRALLIAMVANLSVIAVMALALMVLNPAWLSAKMFLAVPMGEIANCLPLTPGGLGVGEAAFHSLFEWSGLQGGVEAVLCWRIWKAVVGLIGLGVYLGGLGRVVYAEPGEKAGTV
jgi:glycosyltransferase 2 family protein